MIPDSDPWVLLARARAIRDIRNRLAAGVGTTAANALLTPDDAELLAYAEDIT